MDPEAELVCFDNNSNFACLQLGAKLPGAFSLAAVASF